ncbi:MAG: DUF3515 domain-containing protein [Corynebacterium sp.]|nr:DUF3515 domain-containing protein [Corynebacterium sp.]
MGIALLLPILLVIGVIIGVRQLNNPPVAVGTIDSPSASSAACAEVVANAPGRVAGLRRSEIQEPVPAGAAAWSDHITLRCGVQLPLQYTSLSTTENVRGVEWLLIKDETPGSDLATYYSINSNAVIAVTTDNGADPREDISKALSDLSASELSASDLSAEDSSSSDGQGGETLSYFQLGEKQTPHPLPLSDIAATANSDTAAYAAALPESMTDAGVEYTKVTVDETTIGYVAAGYESIVIRLGVGMPESYQAGAQLQQVNNVPWFQETTLANGITSGTWWALGQNIGVAASIPTAAGNATLVTLSNSFMR